MAISVIASTFSDIAIGVAALFTACIAYQGLQTWRKQLEGTAEFETARALIRATYQLRDAICDFRIAGLFAHEFPEGYEQSKATPDEIADAYIYVYINRWPHIAEAGQVFDAVVLEAEALWGSEIRELCRELTLLVGKIHWTIGEFGDHLRSGGQLFRNGALSRGTFSAISSAGGEDNKFTQQLSLAISNMENFLSPKLKKIK